jgi:hypothetical protein
MVKKLYAPFFRARMSSRFHCLAKSHAIKNMVLRAPVILAELLRPKETGYKFTLHFH